MFPWFRGQCVFGLLACPAGGTPMKSIKVSADAMRRRMARFKDLKSYQYQNEAASGIPMEVLEKIAAHRVYPLMVPASYIGRSAQAPIKSAPGLVLSIAECPPKDGP